MKHIIIILAVFCMHFSGKIFAQSTQRDSVFILNGQFSQPTPASKIYLLYQTGGVKFIDSAEIVNQQFQLKRTAGEPVFATLLMAYDNKGLKNLIKKPVDEVDALRFYLHKGEVRLNIKDSISTAVFVNSPINKDYARLKTILGIQQERHVYKLSAQMRKLRTPESGKNYVSFYDSLKLARQPVLKRFVKENPASYIALEALKEYAGSFPDTAEIKPLFKALNAEVRNTMAGIEFDMLLNSNISVGTIAPDFTQNDAGGKPVKLSSFRGKFVLIDFWASWCPSCREENPKWVKIFNELKGTNFTILGVSLDGQDTRSAWVAAIKNDGLTWTQVSDLKHWDNAVIKQYGINAIPQNVLIDPNGRVIAKNIEPGELKKQLEQVNKKR